MDDSHIQNECMFLKRKSMFLQYKLVVEKFEFGKNKPLNQFDALNLNANHDTLKIQKLYTSTYKHIYKGYVRSWRQTVYN